MGNHAVVDKIKNNPKSDAVPRNRSFLWQVALIVAALILVAALGDSFGHQVLHLTKWIASQGTWGRFHNPLVGLCARYCICHYRRYALWHSLGHRIDVHGRRNCRRVEFLSRPKDFWQAGPGIS